MKSQFFKILIIICSLGLPGCIDTPKSHPIPADKNVFPNLADVPKRVQATTDPIKRDEILENLEELQIQAQATKILLEGQK